MLKVATCRNFLEGAVNEKRNNVRLLFERYNGLLKGLRSKYPAACKFVNETNHIENDYIFQLNPFKFFEIPEIYLSELKDFISSRQELQ